MKNRNSPCSIELRLLSTLRHEKVIIESKIKTGQCVSVDSMTAVIKYMEDRIKEIQDRI